MNEATFSGLFARFLYRAMLATRYLGSSTVSHSFGGDQQADSIRRIYVINLDRHGDRWRQIQGELGNVCDQSGNQLIAIARRFSAFDARRPASVFNSEDVQPYYSLADQLYVDPNPRLVGRSDMSNQRIEMTRQEVAVARSHIAVWRLVAAGDPPYTLVLEDDVCFRRGFARSIDRAWRKIPQHKNAFDLLYLSYQEALTRTPRVPVSDFLFRPQRGLWQLSGYVLSRDGAKKLLERLPVRGPVDLWINHQFGSLDVLATQTSIIEQRRDCRSSNSYSILPVLSKVGVLTKEKPILPKGRMPQGPIFAFGRHGSGLTSLAMALSMLGYRCCSDVAELPLSERSCLLHKQGGRVFEAYVNVGSFSCSDYMELAKTHRGARFIVTETNEPEPAGTAQGRLEAESHEDESSWTEMVATPSLFVDELRRISRHVLVLPAQHPDKWQLLCEFLGSDYPSDRYPQCQDQPQRRQCTEYRDDWRKLPLAAKRLRSDSSPWIAPTRHWRGIPLAEVSDHSEGRPGIRIGPQPFATTDGSAWMLRDDTFPSNLTLFRPGNFSHGVDGPARLTLRKERTPVREYTSASICSRQPYLYGRFLAELRPARVPGLVTGVFLHRNAPRQEIDIELLGKDPSKLLVNVYYNPGDDGAKMEFGYRGTPALIDLGFDASIDFHLYEIEWSATRVRWWVDGRLVHERVNWDPTPIPHQPMQFHVNLWHSRSVELAGKLAQAELPASTEVRAIEVRPL